MSIEGGELMLLDVRDAEIQTKIKNHNQACEKLKIALQVVHFWKTEAKRTLLEIEHLEKGVSKCQRF